ncbi:hypothetical protein [Acinetobacter courvalinii]|uniref:hypothetical protein n=1 Tax=Acinetobacter courvalinii TaxID=280147 RepID=UPI00289CE1B2|nr:hypothetical protein [Acinetobacter courvalinii]
MKMFCRQLMQKFKNRKKRKFNQMPDYLLIIIGVPSFLSASYWGLVLGDVVPDFVRAINNQGYMDIFSILISVILLALAAEFWFFSAIAVRCHTILYERWFK